MDFFGDIFREAVSTQVTLSNSVVRLVLAMLLGAVIGWERKRRGQAAGLRTFTLISMGACLAMLLSIYVPQEYLGLKNGDPGRIAAQVVTGVGFLGGGAMIQQKGRIRGLTTAAGIWVVATLGMAVGVGMYGAAVAATVLVLATLVSLERWEHLVSTGAQSRVLNVRLKITDPNIEDFRRTLAQYHIRVSTYYVESDYDKERSELSMVILVRRDTDYMKAFAALRQIAPTAGISLSTQVEI